MNSETAMDQFRQGLVELEKNLGFILNIMRMPQRGLERALGRIYMSEVSFQHLGV